ncbi:hypothetical protein [Gloeobacter kilaueensis]|uniref:Uncharacterized protein n=1 Tax=Gloeobacter kilaueensis (strain ATCC BAA-2537 / CCAP 1431/1 / ULC 316 / JS1) TaxID=1183438 RepID=U5QRN8_GLOK1|nr:hypothetical protein [Gloeobacter kilaueensis]AGY60294.1 hypothetical protein GKIL_4048 [Gloeobacter kilaueensis JS1]
MEERMDRAEQRLDHHGGLLAELRTATLSNTRNLDRLLDINERFITSMGEAISGLRTITSRLDEAVEELRASNRRQEAINDYLLRNDRERSEGNTDG